MRSSITAVNYAETGATTIGHELGQACGVKPGDKLYLPPEERVRVWN